MRGTAPVKIRDIKTILTAPNRIRLVVVKVETTEPGLVGWGCATFTQRALVVQTALDEYLKPFLIGRNVDEIEDIWQSSYMSSYWRNGPVLFNAMSGVDIALWDIKGKRAGMPLYQLLGGKVRHGADCYYHASGASFEEVEENARSGHGARLPPRARAGQHAGLRELRRAQHGAGAAGRPSTRSSARPIRARSGSRRRTCACCRSSSSTCARSSATRSSCCTTSTSASRSTRASTCARRSSRTACSSSRIRFRRRTTITSACCGSRRASRSRWASCSTRSTSTCRSSRIG